MQWRLLCLLALVAVAKGARLQDDNPLFADSAPLPVVLWHGMGDSCCSLGSIGSVKKLIEDNLGK
jgi:palmitoyl-protein thioesterase